MSRLARFTRLVRTLYPDPDACPYHNFNHACQVVERCHHLADRVERRGHTVDRTALVVAALGHDIFFPLEPTIFQFNDHGREWSPKNKEELAAHLTDFYRGRAGIEWHEAQSVKKIILATNPHTKLETVEQMILAAADLHGVGFDDPVTFLNASRQLHEEAQHLTGETIAPHIFYRQAIWYLGLFSKRRIALTPHYFDRRQRSAWHVGMLVNIQTLAHMLYPDNRLEVRVEVGCGKAPLALEPTMTIKENELYVAIDSPSNLEVAYPHLDQRHQTLKLPRPMTTCVPMEAEALSVPSNFAHQVMMANVLLDRHQPSAKEVARILRRRGTLLVRETYQPEGPLMSRQNEEQWRKHHIERLSAVGLALTISREIDQGWELVFTK